MDSIEYFGTSVEEYIKNNSASLQPQFDSFSSTLVAIYDYLRKLVFDNLLIIIILYIVFLYYTFREIDNKFNYWLLLIIPGILLANYVIKTVYRVSTPVGSVGRAKDCLEKSKDIIFNKTIKPIETRTDLLDKPLNEFIISTSHNSYVPCNQNVDISSLDAIQNTLNMGARVIELDCYAKNSAGTSDDDMTPIIVHGIESSKGDTHTTTTLLFEDCIDKIVEYGFLTSDPLIICLELNTNSLVATQKKMKEIIIKKLGNKLLDPIYKLNSMNRKYYTMEPIKNLLNKVIFISGGGYTNELTGIIDGVFGESFLGNDESSDNISMNKPGKMTRIYPAGNLYGHLSQNFDPTPYWTNRYQMVAMNVQTIDANMMKNVYMFKNNSFVHFSQLG